MDHGRSPRGNARRSGSGGASSSKHKSGGGGGKKPIKVLYIDNPMRVKTSAAGFRALVQELTGRHADPSKYSPDDELDSGAAAAAQGLMSPTGADASSDTIVASPGTGNNKAAPPQKHGGDCYDDEEDDDDGFRSQLLLENNYTVFSPPTLLYDHHLHGKRLGSQGSMTIFGPNEAEVNTTVATNDSVRSTTQDKHWYKRLQPEYKDDYDNGSEGFDHDSDKDYGSYDGEDYGSKGHGDFRL